MSKLQTPINNHCLLALSVLLSVGLVALITQAASTISTNITTAGNLTVSGNSTFGDAATDVNLFTGTLQATTTALFTSGLTTYGASVFNEDSAAVDFRVESDGQANMLYVDGTNNLFGSASSTPWGQFSIEAVQGVAGANRPIFVIGDQGTTTPRFIVDGNDGRIGIASSSPTYALDVTGTTTASLGMRIGTNGTPIAAVLAGTCSVNLPSMNANRQGVIDCTATGVAGGDKVFMTPNTLEEGIVFQSASSTSANTIQVGAFNASTTAAINPAAQTWSWLALRF